MDSPPPPPSPCFIPNRTFFSFFFHPASEAKLTLMPYQGKYDLAVTLWILLPLWSILCKVMQIRYASDQRKQPLILSFCFSRVRRVTWLRALLAEWKVTFTANYFVVSRRWSSGASITEANKQEEEEKKKKKKKTFCSLYGNFLVCCVTTHNSLSLSFYLSLSLSLFLSLSLSLYLSPSLSIALSLSLLIIIIIITKINTLK